MMRIRPGPRALPVGLPSSRSACCGAVIASCAMLVAAPTAASVESAAASVSPTAASVSSTATASVPTARFALIVGNNQSQVDGIKPLRFADDDAVQYARLLTPLTRQVVVLSSLDDSTQRRFPGWAPRTRPARRDELARALGELFAEVAEVREREAVRTELLFVFVGHGGVDDAGRGFVHLEDSVLRRDELFAEVVAASPAHTTHLIIDACHSLSLVAGRGEGELTPTEEEGARFERFLTGHDLADFPDVGVLVATSDSRETHEWSRIQAGVFSHLVRSALAGAADINRDGRIEYSEAAAFVDASSATLPEQGQRIYTFAWPPARDRRTPLVELGTKGAPRVLVVEAPVAGRFYVETAAGERWAEFHKPAGQPLHLLLPEGERCFLRDDDFERPIADGERVARVSAAPDTPISSSRRGAAALALERSLFTVPFTWDFYRGYLTGHSHLMAVDASAAPVVLQAAVAPAARAPWSVEAGYLIALSPLVAATLEHGGQVRYRHRLWRGLGAGLALEAGAVPYSQGTLVRAALWPGIDYRLDLGDAVSLLADLELGYSPSLLLGPQTAGDLTIWGARARLAGHWHLGEWLGLYAALGGAAFAVTIDREEVVRLRPELSVGLRFGG